MRKIDAFWILNVIRGRLESEAEKDAVTEAMNLLRKEIDEVDLRVNTGDFISRWAAIDKVDSAPFIKEHPNFGAIVKEWLRDLPSGNQNHIKNKVNLCDSCKSNFAECSSSPEDVIFGDGTGNDNVCCCAEYSPSVTHDLTDEEAIMHLQATGWMQSHDKQMYEMGLKEKLADDSGSYDSLIPCKDVVSRQGVIDFVNSITNLDPKAKGSIALFVKYMPSVTPDRKKGEWERHFRRLNVLADLFWHCSECGFKCSNDYAHRYYRYCPNCGSEMKISGEMAAEASDIIKSWEAKLFATKPKYTPDNMDFTLTREEQQKIYDKAFGRKGGDAMMPNEIKVGGIYKHFKGGLYQVNCLAVHTETSENLVIYESLAFPGMVWARQIDMFCGVTEDGVQRFKEVETDDT